MIFFRNQFLPINRSFQKLRLIVFLGVISLAGCKVDKESTIGNQAPTTYISIEEINRGGADRLVTKVKLNWSATDQDGTIAGFRLAWDQNYESCLKKLPDSPLITRTDSTFLFNFSGADGVDTADIWFMVQAVDNQFQASAEIKKLRIPVRNSAPNIQILKDGLPENDTLWSVLSFSYSFSDPDGEEDIATVSIRINDGTWVDLPQNINFISIVPEHPELAGNDAGVIYSGNGLATQIAKPAPIPNLKVPGLIVGGTNKIYLRIKDLAGASRIDSTNLSYIFRQKTGPLLVIDAYKGSGAFIGDSIYYNILAQTTAFDRIDYIGNAGKNRPKFWGTTLYLQASLYQKVFWYSDIFTTTVGENPLLLTYAVPAFLQYQRFDGKLMFSTIFPDPPAQLPITDPIFSLIPIDSISSLSSLIRLRRDSLIYARQPDFQDLTNRYLVTGVDLFYPRAGVDTLFVVRKNATTSAYTGPPLPVALRTKNPLNNRSNLIFFGMEISYLSGNRSALQSFFNRVFNEEFNW